MAASHERRPQDRSVTIREGQLHCRLHHILTRKGAKTYGAWTVRRRDRAGRLQRATRALKSEVEDIARDWMKTDQGHGLWLTGADVLRYRDKLEDDAEARTAGYRDSRESHRAGLRLRAGTVQKPVAELIAEFLEVKAARCKSLHYLRGLKQRLARFAADVRMPLCDLSAPLLQQWFAGLPVSDRTRENYLGDLTNLVDFAKSRAYLPETFKAVAGVQLAKTRDKEITIFSPDELRLLLGQVSERALPAILIGAFAGLRQSEILHLHWSHIDFADGHIIVPRGKTGRRLAPLLPNLRSWLEPLKAKGPVLALRQRGVEAAYTRAVARANLATRQNALRHSFVSYRMALKKNAAAVAEETGHSVGILKKHYQALATESQAGAWFAIQPDARAGTIQLSLFLPESPTDKRPETAPKRQAP